MYCSKCGTLLSNESKFCTNCGNNLELKSDYLGNDKNISNYVPNNNHIDSNINNNSNYNLNNKVKIEKNFGLYSLICGICSIVFSGIIGFVLGIVSIVLRKKEQEKTQMGKIGKILGILGIVLSIFYLFGIVSFAKSLINFSKSDDVPNYSEQDNFESKVFEPGIIKYYDSLGYMNYIMPECWSYDDAMSAQKQYKSYVFKYKDGKSMADVKALSYMSKVLIDDVRDDIIGSGFVINAETTETINGIEWYKIVTSDYTLSNTGNNYHNVFYLAISKEKNNFYMFNFYVSSDLVSNDLVYFDDSVKYILNNVTLYKYDK